MKKVNTAQEWLQIQIVGFQILEIQMQATGWNFCIETKEWDKVKLKIMVICCFICSHLNIYSTKLSNYWVFPTPFHLVFLGGVSSYMQSDKWSHDVWVSLSYGETFISFIKHVSYHHQPSNNGPRTYVPNVKICFKHISKCVILAFPSLMLTISIQVESKHRRASYEVS